MKLANRTGPVGVWGWVNLEVSVAIDTFPVEYRPSRAVHHGVHSSVAGVAYNVAKALTTLGTATRLTPIVGQDAIGRLILEQIDAQPRMDVHPVFVPESPQTVVFYDDSGQRQLFYDQKDAPKVRFAEDVLTDVERCSIAVLPNNHACLDIARRAKQLGIPVVSDVHDMSDLDDPHNSEFAGLADVLFMSDASLTTPAEQWMALVGHAFGTSVLILTMGAKGALISTNAGKNAQHVPAVTTREVRSTVGAGDSLLAAFVDGICREYEPIHALRRAAVFAGHKIGAVGGAEGFITHAELNALIETSTSVSP